MTIEQLRGVLAEATETAKKNSGTVLVWNERGPVGLGIVQALVEMVEQQSGEIDELKKKLAAVLQPAGPTGAVLQLDDNGNPIWDYLRIA